MQLFPRNLTSRTSLRDLKHFHLRNFFPLIQVILILSSRLEISQHSCASRVKEICSVEVHSTEKYSDYGILDRDRSRSRWYDDSDPEDRHDFFVKSFGKKYERAFQGIDDSKRIDSRKWGLNSAFVADLSRVPDGIGVKTLEAQSRLGIPVNAEQLADT